MARRRDTGMTLIEIGVALCVAGLMLAGPVPAIAGHTCRLVFDLDANVYWSECARSNVRLSREGERAQNGARLTTREEELLAEPQRDGMSEEEKERAALAQKSAFAASNDVP